VKAVLQALPAALVEKAASVVRLSKVMLRRHLKLQRQLLTSRRNKAGNVR